MTILNMVYYKVDSGWEPGANTIAYYPLTSTTTVNDLSGNNYNLTKSGTVTFGTNQGIDCAAFNSNGNLFKSSFYNLSQGDYSVIFWAYKLTQPSDGYDKYVWSIGDYSTRGGSSIIEYDNSRLRFAMWFDDLDSSSNPINQRVNICITYKKSTKTQKIFVNGVQTGTRTTTYTHSLPNLTMYIGGLQVNDADERWKGYLSNVIIENQLRDDLILDYVNLSKGNYGL